MGKNKIKNTSQNTEEKNTHEGIEYEKQKTSKGIIIKILASFFGGKYLENEEVIKHIPFFIFLIIVGIAYITNGNIADKKIRDINKLNKELKELRSEYIITKSELMFLSKQSELAKRLEPLGIKETTQQPYLILTNDTTLDIY